MGTWLKKSTCTLSGRGFFAGEDVLRLENDLMGLKRGLQGLDLSLLLS